MGFNKKMDLDDMIFLGECPICKSKDTIHAHRYLGEPENIEDLKKAKCDSCGTIWQDWFNDLYVPARKKENNLIPVEIACYKSCVKLDWPLKQDIPWSELIIQVLNAALMTRFKLRVCLAVEGGVEGFINREPIELRNFYDEFGLYDDFGTGNKATQRVLAWYSDLLRILFREELVFRKHNYGRGEILRLSKDEPESRNDALIFLGLALLKKTKRKDFVKKVFATLSRVEANPFSAKYLAGLSGEDIVRLFVPPPWW